MIYGPIFQTPVIKRTAVWIIIVLNALIKNKNKNYIMNGWNEMNGPYWAESLKSVISKRAKIREVFITNVIHYYCCMMSQGSVHRGSKTKKRIPGAISSDKDQGRIDMCSAD